VTACGTSLRAKCGAVCHCGSISSCHFNFCSGLSALFNVKTSAERQPIASPSFTCIPQRHQFGNEGISESLLAAARCCSAAISALQDPILQDIGFRQSFPQCYRQRVRDRGCPPTKRLAIECGRSRGGFKGTKHFSESSREGFHGSNGQMPWRIAHYTTL
jgi:hypothetical protein